MFSFDINDHIFKHVHFIGIGGISMSGLAEILLANDYKVTGSDMNNSPLLKNLESKGAKIFIGHDKNNVKGADLIVYTDAISFDNPEYLAGKEFDIPTIDRATFLGQIMRKYKNSIAVSGTHGKTTTTSMLSVILTNSSIDPTILLGGELNKIGGNVKIGKNNCLLTEACEYKGNILKFNPTIAIVLNIEKDHLDYYKNLQHIIDTFRKYIENLPKDKLLIINNDDENVKNASKNAKCKIVTFGIKNNSDFKATDIKFDKKGCAQFNLIIRDNSYKISLNVMGIHNVYNALASIATAYYCNIPMDTIISSIKEFNGTHRRLEYKGSFNNITVLDDYAHHPTEIIASLKAIKNISYNKIWCVFQPHTYTRTKALLSDFATSFYDANKVIIPDIYPAREKDTGLIHSKDLVKALIKNNVDATYFSNFEEITDYLLKNANEGDVIVTMGAGNVYKIGEMLLKEKQLTNIC